MINRKAYEHDEEYTEYLNYRLSILIDLITESAITTYEDEIEIMEGILETMEQRIMKVYDLDKAGLDLICKLKD